MYRKIRVKTERFDSEIDFKSEIFMFQTRKGGIYLDNKLKKNSCENFKDWKCFCYVICI